MTELVAYVTLADVVHAVVWRDYSSTISDLVLACTRTRAPSNTRTSENPEPVTCLRCAAITFEKP